MEFTEARITLKDRYEPWRLWAVGDVHWGAEACDEEAFKRTVSRIEQDPHAYWIGMGDYCDHINHRDSKRFDPRTLSRATAVSDLDDLHNFQIKNFVKLAEPIKSRCLGMLCGNHEESVRLYSLQDPARSLAEWMGVPDLRYSATVRIKVYDGNEPEKRKSRYSMNVFAHHGWGGGRKSGAQVNKAEYDVMDMAPINSDVVLIGHVHRLQAGIRSGFRVSDGDHARLVPHERAWAITGTYLKTWQEGATTYSERSGYPLSVIGSPCFEVRFTNRKVRGHRGDWRDWDVIRYRSTVGSA